MSEQSIFLDALDKADGAERAAYLEQACAGNGALRDQVEALLAAHGREGEFLDTPAAQQMAALTPRERTESFESPSGAERAILADGPQDMLGATDGEVLPEPVNPEDLGFLAPSTKEGSLGRLDHYDVLEVLGNGGMGVVLRAFDEQLRRMVAIKVLAPQLAVSGTARKRFIREAQAAAAVRDEHVVAIHAVSEERPIPFLVMEYIAGQTLEQRIKQGGPIDLKDILRIGLQAAKGLAAAHAQGLVHRDVKPGNILLENGVQRVKLTDFGLARAVDDASLTQSGVVAGTPLYMSPEQAQAEHVDHRTDLFSLGSVLYTMCTGRPPFRGGSTSAVLLRVCEDTPRDIRESNAEIPEWFCALIGKLHAKDPAQRMGSAKTVADLLAGYLAHLQQPHLVPRPQMEALAKPGPKVSRRVLAVTGALLLLMGLGTAGYFWKLHLDRSRTSVASGSDKAPSQPAEEPFVPRGPRTAEELAALASPLDDREPGDIPAGLVTVAGNGDAMQAPAELVAVLGDERFLLPGEGMTWRIARSPDGKTQAVPRGNAVVLFEAATGRCIRVLKGHTGRVYAVAFRPDGKFVAAGNNASDDTIKIWETASGRLVKNLAGHTGAIRGVVFSPDGKRLASASADRSVKVWDPDTGREVFTCTGHEDGVRSVVYGPQGDWLASGADDSTVRIWDARDGHSLHSLAHAPGDSAVCLDISSDGKLLASGGTRACRIFDAQRFELLREIETPGAWLAFTPEGNLWTGHHVHSGAHVARRWDPATGDRVAEWSLASQGGWGDYQLSTDGKTLFGMRADPPETALHAYDTETGKEKFERQGHLGPVLAVALSPDGKRAASAGEDRTVRIWDLARCKQERVLAGHTAKVWSVAFSPNGKLLASGSFDGTIGLWDTADGTFVRSLVGHSTNMSLLAFSPDGRVIAAGGEDGNVNRWDVATGQSLGAYQQHGGVITIDTPQGPAEVKRKTMVRAVAFSPDGKLLASGGADNTVQVCEAATGRRLHTFRTGAMVTNVAFSPDGLRLACTCDLPEATLRFWDLESKAELRLSGHGSHVGGLALHPAGTLAATGASDGIVRFWAPASATVTPTMTIGPGPFGSEVIGIAMTPEGRDLATANLNGTTSVLRVPPAPRAQILGPAIKPPDPTELARKPSPADSLDRKDIPNDLLARAGGGDAARAPAELVAILSPHDDPAPAQLAIAVSPKGDRLASVGLDRKIRLWDLATGKQQRELVGHVANVYGLVFSLDGKILYSRDIEDELRIWDSESGQSIRVVSGIGPANWMLALSPDGHWLAWGSTDGSVRLLSADGSGPLRRLAGHVGDVPRVAFSPDGRLLAAADFGDGTVRLWDVATRWQMRVLTGHAGGTHGVAFSPDGRSLAACSDDGRKLWDLTNGTVRSTLPTAARALAISPDGRLLAGIGTKGIRLVDLSVSPPRERTLAEFDGPWPGCVAFTAEGRYLATCNSDGTLWILRLARDGH